MEIVLRCEVDDVPGSLATLAGLIGDAGGDIEAIEVVGRGREGHVLDDVIVVGGTDVLRTVVAAVEETDQVRLVHAGPSRGHPGDAVTRLAVALEALLVGSSDREHGVLSLVGGLLQASSAHLVEASEAPKPTRSRLVMPFGTDMLVVGRDYPFTDVEADRARSLLRLCLLATRGTSATSATSATSGPGGTVA